MHHIQKKIDESTHWLWNSHTLHCSTLFPASSISSFRVSIFDGRPWKLVPEDLWAWFHLQSKAIATVRTGCTLNLKESGPSETDTFPKTDSTWDRYQYPGWMRHFSEFILYEQKQTKADISVLPQQDSPTVGGDYALSITNRSYPTQIPLLKSSHRTLSCSAPS
jgi:hypothetical protein